MSIPALMMIASIGSLIAAVVLSFISITHMDSGPGWLVSTAGLLAIVLGVLGLVGVIAGAGAWFASPHTLHV